MKKVNQSSSVKSKKMHNDILMLSQLNLMKEQVDFLRLPELKGGIFASLGFVQENMTSYNQIREKLLGFNINFENSPLYHSIKQINDIMKEINYFSESTNTFIGNYKKLNEQISKFSLMPEYLLNINKIPNPIFSSELLKLSGTLTQFENIFKQVGIDSLGERLRVSQKTKNNLLNSFIGLSNSYSEIFTKPIPYLELNVTKLTSLEYFNTSDVLEVISVEDKATDEKVEARSEIQYENIIYLEDYLPKIHPSCYKIWQGAIESYHSNNSDRIRHFTCSLRELITHVIHVLAPDNEIMKWTDDSSMFSQGKPTRKSRLLYIYRNINNPQLEDFIDKDIKSTLQLMDLLQKGTHKIEGVFDENDLIAIKNKGESIIKFILEIHFNTYNKYDA